MGASPLFNVYSRADLNNSNVLIAWFDQGGLGLPDRDYYYRTDAKSAEVRTKYVAHIGRIFVLLGYPQDQAAAAAKKIMNIEMALAKGIDGSCRSPQREQSEPSRYDEGPEGSHSFVQLGWLSCKARRAAVRQPQRCEPRVLQGFGSGPGGNAVRRSENIPYLEHDATQRRDAPDRVRE